MGGAWVIEYLCACTCLGTYMRRLRVILWTQTRASCEWVWLWVWTSRLSGVAPPIASWGPLAGPGALLGGLWSAAALVFLVCPGSQIRWCGLVYGYTNALGIWLPGGLGASSGPLVIWCWHLLVCGASSVVLYCSALGRDCGFPRAVGS